MSDSVVAGLDRNDISLLIVPRLDECRKLAGLAPAALARRAALVEALYEGGDPNVLLPRKS